MPNVCVEPLSPLFSGDGGLLLRQVCERQLIWNTVVACHHDPNKRFAQKRHDGRERATHEVPRC